jgi:hypothetical protein
MWASLNLFVLGVKVMNLYPVDTQEKSHVNNRFPEKKSLQYFFSFSKQINLVSPNIGNTFALFQMCVAGK